MATSATRRRRRRGQALVEYVILSSTILVSGAVAWPYLVLLMNALNKYYASIYFALRAPLP